MAQKKKNSNYVTDKTIAKKEQALKNKKNAKIKRYTLITVAAVLIAACIIAGIVLIVKGINQHMENKASEEYAYKVEHRYDEGVSSETGKQTASGLEATHKITFPIKGYGEIEIELYGKEAPNTVENFLKLFENDFYNGKDILYSSSYGLYVSSGSSSLGTIAKETTGNDLKHVRGTLSTYPSSAKSHGSQFVFELTDGKNTSGTPFGMVTKGMEILDKIKIDLNFSYYSEYTNTSQTWRENDSNYPGKPTVSYGTDDELVDTDVTAPKLEATHTAEIVIKDYGTVKLELYGNDAKKTVENFVKLVNEGFYNGKTFHRAIKDFMLQGGDPKADGTGNYEDKDGKKVTVKGEFYANGVANPIKHERGTISMARGDDMNSASCQFFIVHKTSSSNTISLDGYYAAFGKVTEGMDIIDEIFKDLEGKTGSNGAITKDSGNQPVIESITVAIVAK